MDSFMLTYVVWRHICCTHDKLILQAPCVHHVSIFDHVSVSTRTLKCERLKPLVMTNILHLKVLRSIWCCRKSKLNYWEVVWWTMIEDFKTRRWTGTNWFHTIIRAIRWLRNTINNIPTPLGLAQVYCSVCLCGPPMADQRKMLNKH